MPQVRSRLSLCLSFSISRFLSASHCLYLPNTPFSLSYLTCCLFLSIYRSSISIVQKFCRPFVSMPLTTERFSVHVSDIVADLCHFVIFCRLGETSHFFARLVLFLANLANGFWASRLFAKSALVFSDSAQQSTWE